MFAFKDGAHCYEISIIILPNSYLLKYVWIEEAEHRGHTFLLVQFMQQRRNRCLIPLVLNECSDLILDAFCCLLMTGPARCV